MRAHLSVALLSSLILYRIMITLNVEVSYRNVDKTFGVIQDLLCR